MAEEHFRNAGKRPDLTIWRMKEIRVLEKSEHGQFHVGDPYIVLHTTEANGKKLHNVHMWLGKEVERDECAKVCCIVAVKLDDFLLGDVVQYREVQDHESSLFLSYFKNGVKYLKGGYESGFRHVDDPKFEPRLFQCKGKRNVRVRQMDLDRSSLNLGDVFILDAGADVFVWMPPKSGRLERIKGVRHAMCIRDQERAARADIHVVDEDWDGNAAFWEFFDGFGEVAEPVVDDDSAQFGRRNEPGLSMHKISHESSGIEFVDVPPLNSLLIPTDTFILDAAGGSVFVWIGQQRIMDERMKAMIYASEYLKEKGLPPWSQVVRVLDSAEPSIFTQWFTDAPVNGPTFTPRLFQCSDENGQLIVEEVCNFSQEDLDGDDVLILDTGALIYVWVGNGANDNERQHASSIAHKYLDTNVLPRPSGARVETVAEGSEPSEFTGYFQTWDADSCRRRMRLDAEACGKSVSADLDSDEYQSIGDASFLSPLKVSDLEVFTHVQEEKQRQKGGLELIASENFASRAVLESLSSLLHIQYSHCYPRARYCGGNEFTDELILLCQKRALEVFKLDESRWGVSVQPYSGSPANFAVYTALTEPNGRLMGFDLAGGGHLTPFNPETFHLQALKEKPMLIVTGVNCSPRLVDYAKFREICDGIGSLLMVDMAHISGVVATAAIPSPFPYADIVNTTTHTSLRGPRGGIIFYRKGVKNLKETIEAVFPGLQGGRHNNTIAGIAVALEQAKTQEFVEYQKQVLENAQVMAERLRHHGYSISTGGTENHLCLINLRPKGTDGTRVETVLELMGVACNKNTYPGDKSALRPGGIRLGAAALTSRKFKKENFNRVVDFIHEGIELTLQIQAKMAQSVEFRKYKEFQRQMKQFKEFCQNDKDVQRQIIELKRQVEDFAFQFPLPGYDDFW